jgi:sec-independent protein translocase protein TatB
MFGIDAPELMVIAIVALIIIGPKELPGVLRMIGRWVATARNMAGEFRGHVDDMMRQAELDDLKKHVEAGAKDAILDLQGLDPTREIKSAIEDGARDAEQEMAAARASIDSATADAVPPPPIAAAELATPPAPSLGADVSPAEPEFAAVPPANERLADAGQEAPATSPAGPEAPAVHEQPASETGAKPAAAPPQKVAVG